MDKQETLGLEKLGIGGPRRKRDYTERRLKRAKGRRGEDPDLAPDEMPRNQPSEAFQQSQGRIPAWVDSVPSYTPLKIEPLGSVFVKAEEPAAKVQRTAPRPSPLTQKGKPKESSTPQWDTSSNTGKTPTSRWPSRAATKAQQKGIVDNTTRQTRASATAAAAYQASIDPPSQPQPHNQQRTLQLLKRKSHSKHHQKLIPTKPPPTTKAYLTRASIPPTRLSNPHCLLLVLDLNGTLLHRKRSTSSYSPRPFLDRFITYALAHHRVLIWSSAQGHNVQSICSRIFTRDQQSRLLGVWARDTLGLSAAQYGEKVQVYKQLQKVWADKAVQAAHPDAGTGGQWDQGNTVLIDDSKEKARAEPWNLVEVPEFLGPGKSEGEEDVLGQVERWVEEAKGWSDVSGFVKAMGQGFVIGTKWKGEKGGGQLTARAANEYLVEEEEAVWGEEMEEADSYVEGGSDQEMTDDDDDTEGSEDGGVQLPVS